LLKKLFSRRPAPELPVDGFPFREDHPYLEEHQAISRFLTQLDISVVGLQEDLIRDRAEAQAILQKDSGQQLRFAHALVERILFRWSRAGMAYNHQAFRDDMNRYWRLECGQCSLLAQLLRRKLPWTEAELVWVLSGLNKVDELPSSYFPYKSLLGKVKTALGESGSHAELTEQLTRLSRRFPQTVGISGDIRFILEGASPRKIEAGEPWSDRAIVDLAGMAPQKRIHWEALLDHAIRSDGSKPSKAWLKQAQEVISRIGEDEARKMILSWIQLAEKKVPQEMPVQSGSLLKGLVWCCMLLPGDTVSRGLGDLAVAAFYKIPNFGPRAVKVGNACIYILSVAEGKQAVSQLVRLGQKVKYAEAQRLTQAAVERQAAEQQMSVADLEETSVPTFDLGPDSRISQQLGKYRAEIRVTSVRAVSLVWISADGKAHETVPAVVKESYPSEVEALRKTRKAIETTLSAQCDRIERLLLRQPVWTYTAWRARYLDHPLLQTIARRMIWHFSNEDRTVLGIWLNGGVVDLNQQPLDWLTPATQVRLWHPLETDPQTVLVWRKFLETQQITQPFKQAHREIYLLTDAELQTGTYSNRFAAHILRQHQFAALCKERGWHYTLQGNWDSFNIPTLSLPELGLSVDYLVEPVQDEVSDMQVFSYVATDQVRFYNQQGERLPLEEVPALCLSEVLRDVDLFVGVCSIGNDPTWLDRGPDVYGGEYWQRYAFGSLEESGKNRKEVLEQLLPRLKIADRCHLTDRYLVVEGQFHTYQIHLGSANIQMDNGRYLCIVPGKSSQVDRLYLPFEGDRTLSLILSKAFLLAEDTQITDATILRQIR
jgi:hypothetical protein